MISKGAWVANAVCTSQASGATLSASLQTGMTTEIFIVGEYKA
jgi:hypothetical protein